MCRDWPWPALALAGPALGPAAGQAAEVIATFKKYILKVEAETGKDASIEFYKITARLATSPLAGRGPLPLASIIDME